MNKYKKLTQKLKGKTIKERFPILAKRGEGMEIMLFSDGSYAVYMGEGTLEEKDLSDDIKKNIEEIKRLKFIDKL